MKKGLRSRLWLMDARRRWWGRMMVALLWITVFAALAPLGSVFIYVVKQGWSALNWSFFTELPKPVGEEGGGIGNALLGSTIIVGLASAVGVPWGIATGLYLSEYRTGRVLHFLRFTTDLLTSVPSIVIGLFAYAVLVKPFGGFSALAGGLALAIIVVPVVARTTEEVLKLVPDHIREAGLALGLPRWKVILWVVLRGSLKGVFTGIILAVARVAGETAPLLFTAAQNRYWSTSLTQPMASLPTQIYTYAISPFDDWHRQAWAGAFVLVLFVFSINLTTRLVFSRR